MKPICGSCKYTMIEGKGGVILQDHGIHRVKSYHCPNSGCSSLGAYPNKVYIPEADPYVNAHMDAKEYTAEVVTIVLDIDIEMLNVSSPCDCGQTVEELIEEQRT